MCWIVNMVFNPPSKNGHNKARKAHKKPVKMAKVMKQCLYKKWFKRLQLFISKKKKNPTNDEITTGKKDTSKDFIISKNTGNKGIKRSYQVVTSKQRKGGYLLKHRLLKLGNHCRTVLWMSKLTLLKDIIRPIHGRKIFHELSDPETPTAGSGNPWITSRWSLNSAPGKYHYKLFGG